MMKMREENRIEDEDLDDLIQCCYDNTCEDVSETQLIVDGEPLVCGDIKGR